MSVVSDGNLWMFVASNGGLTAGRQNAQYALFPYATDDKLVDTAEVTGPKTVVRVGRPGGKTVTWEPFSERDCSGPVRRRLYKSVHGNSVVFEEEHPGLGLTFAYRWAGSTAYGFAREARLTNTGDAAVRAEVLDGLLNLMPYGVGPDLQAGTSNLVDAYKRSELDAATGLGIYALSAIIVDRAEPSEALRANVAWSAGLAADATYLLSARQLDAFRDGQPLRGELDVKGERMAYLTAQSLELGGGAEARWTIAADVNQDRSDVARLLSRLRDDRAGLARELWADVRCGTERLVALVASADGLQETRDDSEDARHFANVLFNCMRGGVFDDGYRVDAADFAAYLRAANRELARRHADLLEALPAQLTRSELLARATAPGDPDLERLATEYLPLKFSRRHGDPSRPWNKFSINTHRASDGARVLDYEGNWRDLFQNWEALAWSFPDFIDGMIARFVNASTFDGYNPYRVTKGGFDWETIEPDDPWSYIGYWGDHQVIYLLKFLEFAAAYAPERLAGLLARRVFVYADVPYRIKAYGELLRDPKDTVVFDREADRAVRERRAREGADGALLRDRAGRVHRVSLAEKLLAMLLAKVGNLIPGGGIWMNTQRPEWNDANNALVGNGVSMVTLYYLRRFAAFAQGILASAKTDRYPVSRELLAYLREVDGALARYADQLGGKGDFTDAERGAFTAAVGTATSDYRDAVYAEGFAGEVAELSRAELAGFLARCEAYCDHSMAANRRADGLYHGYNLMTVAQDGRGIAVSHLAEMLEGQVAALSAGKLDAREVAELLDALRASRLYRPDQRSYLLYPNKDLPGFLAKNDVPAAGVEASALLTELLAAGDHRVVSRDVDGAYHFAGDLRNVGELRRVLDELAEERGAPIPDEERRRLERLYEQVFDHKSFTGRSGTFFGYEGLGSIYWHMVSKLRLAVAECYGDALAANADADLLARLRTHYYAIREGLGVHKPPALYGAFPTDPYSHTPAGKGAQQPGMTGQVKEDILSRLAELGVGIEGGRLRFAPRLLQAEELLRADADFAYVDLDGAPATLRLRPGELAFTYCQVPVVYAAGAEAAYVAELRDGGRREGAGELLDPELSAAVFLRTGELRCLRVTVPERQLVSDEAS